MALTLLCSMVVQITAAIFALRLIRITGSKTAWGLIALAASAMAVRRCLTLYGLMWPNGAASGAPTDLAAELVALATSGLLLVGIIFIRPLLMAMKRTERDLRESKETLDAILATSPAGVGMVRQNRLGWANNTLLRMFGYKLTEWIDQPIAILFPSPQEYKAVHRQLSRELSRQGSAYLDCRMVTKQGRYLDAYVQLRSLDIGDDSKGAILAATDITKRKLAQKALRESQEKYRLVVENANDAIFILQDDKVNFPNTPTAEVLHQPARNLTGISYLDLVHHEDRPLLIQLLAETLDGDSRMRNHLHRLIGPAGEVLWMEMSAIPISWQGEPAVLCFLHDITAQKKLERQLLHAQKMEAVGRMAGGVAHDFNNLLQVIGGYSELVLKSLKPGDPNYEYVKYIIESGRKASRLTRQLLTFSRKHLVETQEFELSELVAGLEKMLRRIIGEDVLLDTNLAPGAGFIKADPGQMEQVIMNLAVNARDAMPGGGCLRISTKLVTITEEERPEHPGLAPGPHTLLQVSDTGCGMSQEALNHVFEPFFTTKESGKGTGLGLSTAYGIVKTFNGEINVDSEPGRGSTFSIYLPCGMERTEPRHLNPTASSLAPSGTETLLLVEDEDHVRNLMAESLRMSGYQVLTAASGIEALELLDRLDGEVHLLITDVVMPRMSGPQLAAQVKLAQPKAKVIFISGYPDHADRARNLDLNGSVFLQKPFTVDSLAKKVREVLTLTGCSS
jgi:PAS domain S-box-containing protein